MTIHTRAYDDEHGAPVIVLAVSGLCDVSRIINTLHRGNTEHAHAAARLVRQVKRHNGGRTALALLHRHGGPDLTGGEQCAWHVLRRTIEPHPLDDIPTEMYRIEHPEECAELPPGAACWATRQVMRDWWPVGLGAWRIRPAEYIDGGDEDGPNIVATLDVEPLDEPGAVPPDLVALEVEHRAAKQRAAQPGHCGYQAYRLGKQVAEHPWLTAHPAGPARRAARKALRAAADTASAQPA